MFHSISIPQPTPGVRSRSINAENPTGAIGAAAQAASNLGPGRKGSAYYPLPAGETLTLANIEGPGVIRHIWITVAETTPAGPFVLRDLVLRAYWDGSEHPSVEVPLGDFFCNGFATRALVTSVPIVVAPTRGMNSYFPMPFRQSARLTLESQHGASKAAPATTATTTPPATTSQPTPPTSTRNGGAPTAPRRSVRTTSSSTA